MSRTIYDQIRETTDVNLAIKLLKEHFKGYKYDDSLDVKIGDFVVVNESGLDYRLYADYKDQIKDKIFRVAMVLNRDSSGDPYVWLSETDLNPYIKHIKVVAKGFI